MGYGFRKIHSGVRPVGAVYLFLVFSSVGQPILKKLTKREFSSTRGVFEYMEIRSGVRSDSFLNIFRLPWTELGYFLTKYDVIGYVE